VAPLPPPAAAAEPPRGAGGTAVAVRADVADELDVERLFTETAAAFGNVDVVVHTTQRDTSVVNRQAARQLRHGGAIANVSSSGAVTPVLAHELRARGITVDEVAPGREPPGGQHDIADLIALLDRWRRSPGK
jgi:3-oxoacyl-[acyl-carrier protein] reductase